ncbi:hypothetical protein C8T65DRAFT_736894 [Cerioporus squamosus]|nr:hypothetical protein C8T65DRAFT_736894 [Cerioporus squamosus]
MSSDGDAETSDIIAFFASLQPDAYVALSAIVFFLYDYIITFGREVELFWTRKVTGASVLFLLIRYGTLLYKILDLVVYAPISDKRYVGPRNGSTSADPTVKLFHAVSSVHHDRDSPISSVCHFRGYAGLGIEYQLDVVGTRPRAFSSAASGELGPILSRAGFILADLLLVIITWRSLATGHERARLGNGKRMTFADILFWNGTLYFVTLFTLNVLHLSFSLPALFNDDGISDITVFTDPLSAVLICRFLLDLQEANQRVVRLDADEPLSTMDSVGSLSFVARTMGSLRTTIVPGFSEDDDISETDVAEGSSVALEALHERETKATQQHEDLVF